MKQAFHFVLLLTTLCGYLPAVTTLSENFDDVSALSGAGWSASNFSLPPGTTSWFQGNSAVFAAQAGPANSYIAANFEAAGFGGNINDWLFTPAITIYNGDVLSFYTRSDGEFGDNLEVRYSTNGTSTSVGDFSNLLLAVNPTGSAAGYPTAWTQYSGTIGGLNGSATGRFAFRYVVTDTSVNGDYVGVDSVLVTSNIPEPATAGLLTAAATVLLGLGRRRRRPNSETQPKRKRRVLSIM